MLTFLGRKRSFCDGVSRRDFLQAGALAIGGLTLADVLRLQAAAGTPRGTKSVIMIYLPGGPTHLDTYDLKPEAPVEFRGEFSPIATTAPGMQLCELMPRQATIAQRLSIVRGLVTVNEHSAHMVMTGFPDKVKRPAFGSVVSYLRAKSSTLPPYVSLMNSRQAEDPAYTGPACKPFTPSGQGLDNLKLVSGVSLDRLSSRRALLGELDTIRRDIETDGALTGIDSYNARALDMLTSTAARDAFDISLESPQTRELYGRDNESFLKARRLVEAGVSVVTLATGGWDTHGQNFQTMRKQLPRIDQGLHALVTDLDARGLGQDVAVVMWGEFGRTPRINRNAGRDHWPSAGFALLAGAVGKGEVIGASDARGERPKGEPITPSNVLTTLYDHLGINPAMTLRDTAGRPMYLLDDRRGLPAFV